MCIELFNTYNPSDYNEFVDAQTNRTVLLSDNPVVLKYLAPSSSKGRDPSRDLFLLGRYSVVNGAIGMQITIANEFVLVRLHQRQFLPLTFVPIPLE